MNRSLARLLVRTWLTIAAIDFVFATCLSVFAYHSTFTRFWQGIASVLIGPSAFEGGTQTLLLGILLHLSVAFTWSIVFLTLAMSWPRLRRMLATPGGVLAVAAVYGPCIWLVMSLIVIPTATGRAPSFTFRWWVQIPAHIPFVALPIVWTVSRGIERVVAGATPHPTASVA